MKTSWKTGVAALATFATLTPMSSVLADQFYYNASNGAGAFGVLDRVGNFTNISSYGSGTFSTGQTSIVDKQLVGKKRQTLANATAKLNLCFIRLMLKRLAG